MMMAMAHPTIISVAIGALATGIVAATYWFRSAAVPLPQFDEPVASISDAPEQHIMNAVVNVGIIQGAMNESAKLNRIAAVWTGVSALLGALTTVPGT